MPSTQDLNSISLHRPKHAIKHFKSRLTSRNPKIQLLTLNLLDAAVKACHLPMHTEIGSKDFLAAISNLIRGRDTDEQVKEKAKECIQTWAFKFADKRDILPNFASVYSSLQSNGVKFAGNVQERNDIPALSTASTSVQAGNAPSATISRKLPESKVQKLKSDLAVVQENINLTNEMIDASEPGHHVKSNELLNELVGTLRAMKAKLLKLIANLQEEDLLALSTGIKGQLEYTLDRYDELSRGIRPQPRSAQFHPRFEEIKSPLLDPVLFDSPAPVVPPVKSKPLIEDVFGLHVPPTTTQPVPSTSLIEFNEPVSKPDQHLWAPPQAELNSTGLFWESSPAPPSMPSDLFMNSSSIATPSQLPADLFHQPVSAPVPIFNQGADLIGTLTPTKPQPISSPGYPQFFTQPPQSYPNMNFPPYSQPGYSAQPQNTVSASIFATEQPKVKHNMMNQPSEPTQKSRGGNPFDDLVDLI
jgi:hypothetical protein